VSTEQSVLDAHYMARAIELARKGLYTTHPNPRVGCVIVRDGQVVGEGWHVRAGEPHAEVHALRAAGELARGATAYVTLEPCSHHGRTPPCAEGLVTAGVARVVAAMQDPNPEVAGRGLKRLTDAGIDVRCGVLETQARALNQGFLKRMEHGLPFVRVKLAMSLDGRTAMASGESQWITGPAARSAVQRLRAEASVVITGADTVLADGARLTVRADELGLDAEQTALVMSPPAAARVDRWPPARAARCAVFQGWPGACGHLRTACRAIPHGARVPGDPGRERSGRSASIAGGAGGAGRQRGIGEAGPRLAGAFAEQGLVDEYVIFVAGKFLGSAARPLLDWPLEKLSRRPRTQDH
jgi:diaminohydroxyphosphoribosylaminopyrimidine deaminase / 5-amino-6-(5-phosphoribosylamino)uracil reductase